MARKAGVSQSTVSMVLNKKYNVSFSKDVVHKVEEAARELGYEDSIRTAGFVLSLIGLIGGALAFVACAACVGLAGIAGTAAYL